MLKLAISSVLVYFSSTADLLLGWLFGWFMLKLVIFLFIILPGSDVELKIYNLFEAKIKKLQVLMDKVLFYCLFCSNKVLSRLTEYCIRTNYRTLAHLPEYHLESYKAMLFTLSNTDVKQSDDLEIK